MQSVLKGVGPGRMSFHRSIISVLVVAGCLTCGSVFASFSESALTNSIVAVQVTSGRDVALQTSGFVVQADRFNGYIVTNAEAVAGANSLTVTVPGTGGRLVAQVVRSDLSNDYALLKVNGLDLPALEFAREEPTSGEVVWTAAKINGSELVSLSKGLLRTGFKLAHDQTGWYQHTASNPSSGGSVLLNECGHVLGLNFRNPAGDGSTRAVDMGTMFELLAQQNIKPTVTSSQCVSEVVKAREKAEAASEEARQAQSEAIRAQEVARELERELNAPKLSNDGLLRQTEIARQRADEAIAAAESAKARADNTQRELEEKTLVLREETQALLKAFEEERVQAEARFQDLLQSQQESAESRERILLAFSGALIIVIGFVLFLGRVRNGAGGSPRTVIASRLSSGVEHVGESTGNTEMHRQELAEYVLDGRDDDGIRYLLRISGDQLVKHSDGVIIGRNPKDSPYIINHADVSRKHARIKVENNRVFIEDLGSTNGTSVNGQSIDDKGLVSVSSGDQIIIGSVVMKLRVMEG